MAGIWGGVVSCAITERQDCHAHPAAAADTTAPTGRTTAPTGRPAAAAGRTTGPGRWTAAPAGGTAAPTGRTTSRATAHAGWATAPTGWATAPAGWATAPAGRAAAPTGRSAPASPPTRRRAAARADASRPGTHATGSRDAAQGRPAAAARHQADGGPRPTAPATAQAACVAGARQAPAGAADRGGEHHRGRVHNRRTDLRSLPPPYGGDRARGGHPRHGRLRGTERDRRHLYDVGAGRGDGRCARVRPEPRRCVPVRRADRDAGHGARRPAEPGAGAEDRRVRQHTLLARRRARGVPKAVAAGRGVRALQHTLVRRGPAAGDEGAAR